MTGRTISGVTDASGKPLPAGWEVVDGALHRKAFRAGNLLTERSFDNFDPSFEWTINKAGNSGLKYRTFPVPAKGLYACEYQILDDDNHPNGKSRASMRRKGRIRLCLHVPDVPVRTSSDTVQTEAIGIRLWCRIRKKCKHTGRCHSTYSSTITRLCPTSIETVRGHGGHGERSARESYPTWT
jgi:hypothetical protein